MKTYIATWQWLLSAILATWFLFVHSPPVLVERGAFRRPDFFLHLAGAYVVYLACMHNTLYNPFLSKSRHVLVGQVGLACGTIGFVMGLFTVVTSWSAIDKGFAIGITVGGIMQMKLQYRGYVAIRQYKQLKEEISQKTGATNGTAAAKDVGADSTTSSSEVQELRDRQRQLLRTHVGCMIALMVNACGMPAAMRLVSVVGLGSGYVPIVAALGVLTQLQSSHNKAVTARLHLDGKKEE